MSLVASKIGAEGEKGGGLSPWYVKTEGQNDPSLFFL